LLVLFELLLLVSPPLQLPFILLFEGLHAEDPGSSSHRSHFELLLLLPSRPDDLLFVGDAQRFKFHASLLLRLLFDRFDLGFLPLQFDLRPHVERDPVRAGH